MQTKEKLKRMHAPIRFWAMMTLILTLLSGCVYLPASAKSAFTPANVQDFGATVVEMQVFKDTTATPELKAKYRADWKGILNKLSEYERQIE